MPPPFELDVLLSILPHRPPFLFIDRVTELDPGKRIEAERMLRPDEPQFSGHFPGRPIMPGVLVTEALAQASGLLLGLTEMISATSPPEHRKMFHLAASSVKHKQAALPGDLLRLKAEADRGFGGLFRFNVEATVGEDLVASGSVTLALVEGGHEGASSAH